MFDKIVVNKIKVGNKKSQTKFLSVSSCRQLTYKK